MTLKSLIGLHVDVGGDPELAQRLHVGCQIVEPIVQRFLGDDMDRMTIRPGLTCRDHPVIEERDKVGEVLHVRQRRHDEDDDLPLSDFGDAMNGLSAIVAKPP